jgi:ABC-type glutathione transport system ATPase component
MCWGWSANPARGKTTVALSLLGHRAWNSRVTGQVLFQGAGRAQKPPGTSCGVCAAGTSPMCRRIHDGLNPARRVGSLLAEFLQVTASPPAPPRCDRSR